MYGQEAEKQGFDKGAGRLYTIVAMKTIASSQPVRRAALAAVACCVALAACSCEPATPVKGLGIHGKRLIDPTLAGKPAFQLRFTFIRHRMAASAKSDDLWRFFDEGVLPEDARALWNKNDLRAGLGGQIAVDRVNKLLTTRSEDYTFIQKVVGLREGTEMAVALTGSIALPATGGSRRGEVIRLLYENETGQKMGRSFTDTAVRFIIRCRTDPDDPEYIRIKMTPQVVHGREVPRFVRTRTGIVSRRTRPRFTFGFLSAEVRVPPKNVLILGGRQTSPLSLGGHFFFDRQATDTWSTIVVIVPERVVGEVAAPENPSPRRRKKK